MLKIHFAAPVADWDDYEAQLNAAAHDAGLKVEISPDAADPAQIDYVIYSPEGDLDDFGPYTRARAVLSLWAGVERIAGNPTLTQPLVRMVDPEGLTQGMVEWVTGHVLRHHLGMDAHILNPERRWAPRPPPLAPNRKVTLLGLGALGAACASALAQLGFDVTGWSRSAKDLPGVTCLSGEDGLRTALSGAEILVLLLPRTPGTENLLNAARLSLLAPGAAVLNPGRGPLIEDDALLAALDSGQVGHATLDVFRVEPLPQDHPFWAHPKVTVTPHIAAATRPATAARAVIRTIAACEAGDPLPHLVDRRAGY